MSAPKLSTKSVVDSNSKSVVDTVSDVVSSDTTKINLNGLVEIERDLDKSETSDLAVNFDLPATWQADAPAPATPEPGSEFYAKDDYRSALKGFTLKATLALFSIGKDGVVAIDRNGNLLLNGISARVGLTYSSGQFTVHTPKLLPSDSAITKAAQRKVSTALKLLTAKPVNNLLALGSPTSLTNALDLSKFNPALFVLFEMAEIIRLNPTVTFSVAFELACLQLENEVRSTRVRETDFELMDSIKTFTVPRTVTDLFSAKGLDFAPTHSLFSSGNDARSGAYAVLLPVVE